MSVLLILNIFTKITRNAAHFNNRRQKNQDRRRHQEAAHVFTQRKEKKETKGEKKSFEAETIKRLLLFQPFQSNNNSKIWLVGPPCQLTILFKFHGPSTLKSILRALKIIHACICSVKYSNINVQQECVLKKRSKLGYYSRFILFSERKNFIIRTCKYNISKAATRGVLY